MPALPGPSHPAHPPRPRLTLRVGVTGHRWGASLEAGAIPRIEAQLRGLFQRCTQAAEAVGNARSDVFCAQQPLLIAVSSLAEGGDRLFAREALATGWQVEAVLPFAANEYEKDFERVEAKEEFRALLARAASVFEIGDPRREKDPSEAYETAGLVMLDHADLVAAIWDGGESRGRGGTREIVDEAIRRGIPVIWINTTSAQPAALWDGMTAAPLPELDRDAPDAPAKFDDTVRRVLATPRAGEPGTELHDAQRLQRFLAETERPAPWWTVGYDIMLRLTAKRPFRMFARPPSIASRQDEWDGFIADLPPSGALAAELREVLLARFLWADHIAGELGRAYRGAYVLNFALAALAVSAGLLALFYWDSILVKTIAAMVEFVLISLILAVTHAGARGAWHQRFLDARRLAEMLRHARVLAPLGRVGGADVEIASPDAGERWTAWYATATRRELSLPHARADAAYRQKVTAATMGHEVAPQLAYHRANHRRLHMVHHSLDRFGERLFYLTGILCLVWVACAILYETLAAGAGWIKYGVKPLLTFLGAVLPAIGATLAGIRAQGDFEASAKRSLATERELEQISERLAHTPPGDYREACLVQLWIADAMASDLGSWRSLYANRPLTIPG